MAEKMANASTKRVSELISGSTTCSDKAAGQNDSKITTVTGMAELQKVAEPERSDTDKTNVEKSGPVRRPGQLCDRALDYVFDHFNEIIEGLMKGIDAGNASGARLLFDLSRSAQREPDEAGLGPNRGIGLTELLDPAFRLESLAIPEKPASEEPSQDDVDSGLGGVETQLTIARGA
jgi:hypothetical protein